MKRFRILSKAKLINYDKATSRTVGLEIIWDTIFSVSVVEGFKLIFIELYIPARMNLYLPLNFFFNIRYPPIPLHYSFT